jgi:hypothetical protein
MGIVFRELQHCNAATDLSIDSGKISQKNGKFLAKYS